jgi:phospholipase C
MRALALLALLLLAPSARAQAPLACSFGAGALPAVTLPAGDPHGDQIPVDHIVVLMQENRSFDHYLGRLHRQGQRKAEGEPARASNPDPTGGPDIRPFHQTQNCEVADLNHGWTGSHHEWNGGTMDGFTAANAVGADPTGRRTMGYYTRRDLPFYYRLYRTFAIGDRYFCSLLGPTFPNRYYLLAGTSFGHISNDFPSGASQWAQRSVFDLLDEAGVSWRIYQSQLPFGELFAHVRANADKVVAIDRYFTDAAAGTLPQVAFVDPIFAGAPNVENDEHPPANVQVGQAFAARVIRGLLASPLWSTSALFLVYDEHGGFFDHVPPPPACVPDDVPPNLGADDVDAAFDRYGFRVPVVVVSPFARKHFVSHVVHDHTSILRFIETRFDLPALTRRDANADPMLEFFDFAKPRFVRPPRLPSARIDAKRLPQCEGAAGASSGEL